MYTRNYIFFAKTGSWLSWKREHVCVCCRLAKLEESLKDESLSEEQRHEKRLQHAQKETEFLRLKRSR